MSENNKIDRIEELLFSLSPSFYAIVSGSLIGIATEMLSNFYLVPEKVEVPATILLTILLMFSSSVCLAFISITLEQLRAQVTGEGEATRKYNLRGEIHKRRKILWPLFIGALAGLASIIIIV